jgi:hypothetical protein
MTPSEQREMWLRFGELMSTSSNSDRMPSLAAWLKASVQLRSTRRLF